MKLEIIYKRDVGGLIRVWYAEIGEEDLEGHWRTVSGLLDGEKITSEWRWAEPRSQFDAQEQAIFEAKAAMKKKLKVDYRKSLKDVDDKRQSFIKPMLAHKYEGWEGPCFVQPKLDGMRAIVNKDGLWSRLNNRIMAVPHVEARLKEFFKHFPEIIIDGELYNHDLKDDFNMIMSLTKKTTRINMEDLDRSERYIQFWIFDMFDENNPKWTFSDRWRFLQSNLFDKYPNKSLVQVPTHRILTKEDLELDYITLLEQGYEGQMLRYDRPYEQKRSSVLIKRKEYVDAEFELVEIQEGQGNWEGLAKIAVCKLDDGRTFGAGISGTQEYCNKLLKQRNKYQAVTVKYFALTPDGVPRFPIAIKFWEGEFDALEERIKPRKDLFR